MKKRIIIDGRGLRNSTGRYTRKILDYMQNIDQENTFIVLINQADDAAWSPLKKSTNFSKEIVPYLHYSFGEQIGFARYLYSLKPDLVWFTMPQQPLLYTGKTATTIHDLILLRFQNIQKSALSFRVKQFIFRHVVKLFARRSEVVLTVSQHSKDDIATFTGTPHSRIVLTYNAADKITEAPRSIPELSGKKFLLYVGNAHIHKNLPRMLEAFSIVKRSHPDLHVAFAGNKTIHYERLQLLADALDGRDSVHILGRVNDAQLRWLYEKTALYVFPSLDEGFGLPGLEAMQHDAPVVASNASCLPEVYGDSVDYFNPLDPADIAHTITAVLDNPKHAQQLVSRGKKQLKKYSWEKTAQKTHAALMAAASQ